MNKNQLNGKTMSIRLAMMLAGMLYLFGFAECILAQTSTAGKVVNAYIQRKARSQDATEYEEARKMVFGDVDGDGDKDAVVQFTIEGMGGGNSFSQILAVFINRRGVYKFAAEEVVGGKFDSRTSSLTNIKNGKISLTTESCAEPPQGPCDDPKKGIATFVFNKGKLKEL